MSRKTLTRCMILGLLILLLAVPTAYAGFGGSSTPDFPGTTTVGDTGIPVGLDLLPNITGADTGPVELVGITLIPSCGSQSGTGTCGGGNEDPGVFSVSAAGTGADSCAGINFSIAETNATNGEVTFTPSVPVILNNLQNCRINFTVDVLQAPTLDASIDPGVQTAEEAKFSMIKAAIQVGSGTGSDLTQVIFCGDNVLNQAFETCDPPGSPAGGNGNDCRIDCTVCGDANLDPGEECDDGNGVDGDTCNNDCTIPICGDGIVGNTPGETCDPPGSPAGGNGNDCREDCTVCGDANVDPGEECDDGNGVDGDTCNNDCTIPICGDGIVGNTPGETCDPPGSPAGGNGNDCREDCTVCGDANLDPGEECDDGNGVDGDTCNNNCTIPICGDGIVGNTPGETCDPPGSPAGGNGNDCREDCTVCGDANVDPGEECDDGNGVDGDTCNNNCTIPICGDGIVGNTPGETCDPPGSPAGGNGNDCREDCTVCGDANVDPGEECDDGNGVDGDTCNNDCTIPLCGDGIVGNTPGETCDPPGSPAGGNGNDCREDCTVCGDSVLDTGEECDDGNGINFDGCNNNCMVETCGVLVDKNVDCGTGAVDTGLVSANEDGTNGCSADNGDVITVGYNVQNTGNVDLVECTLVDSNGNIVAPGPIGTVAEGNTSGFGPSNTPLICSDDLEAGEPDTVTVICECGAPGSGLGQRQAFDEATFICEPVCGDGSIDTNLDETCDPPGLPGPGPQPGICDEECHYCGDGIPGNTAGEVCDDGNGINGDGCDNECQPEECDVLVDKIVDCGDGPVDVGLVSANEDGTNGCSALNGSPIIVTYNVQNTGDVPLANCNLVDSNGEIVPGSIVGDIIPGAMVGVSALDAPETCSDALDAGEPDTVTVDCDCVEPGGPLGTVQASDEADIDCLECDVELIKEFSCDGGLTYGDGCTASEFDTVLVQYTITNLSDPGVTLDECVLSDDNPVIEGVNPGTPIGPITLPEIELLPPLVCDAQLLLEEPDTGRVDCACTDPAGNTDTVSATDDSDVDCPPDLEVGCRMTGGHNVMAGVEAQYDDIDTDTKYTTGGQIGAPNEGGCYRGDYPIKHAKCVDDVCNGGRYYGEVCSIDDDCPPATGRNAGIPYGDWEHNHHSGPDDGYITGGSFAFHSGTAAAPDEAFIQSIICADEGWCVQARPAPDKQIFWEGYGVFHNLKKGKNASELPIFEACGDNQPTVYSRKNGGTLHYYRAHVGDFGEPAGRHQKNADLCPWQNTTGVSISDCSLADNYDPLVPATENVKFTEAHPLCLAQDCVECPDWYEIEIHCTDQPDSPIAYKVAHHIRQGNFQIHPPVGDSCNPEDYVDGVVEE